MEKDNLEKEINSTDVEDTTSKDMVDDNNIADAADNDNVNQNDSQAENADSQVEDSEEKDGDDKSLDKKKFFGKKKPEKKDPRDEKIEELEDRLKRQMAEFDNFRKRTDKEKTSMYEIGAKSIVEKILPIVDNFERGFASVTEEGMEDPFVAGMDKVYKQLMKSLEEAGVKAIEAVGNEFDPNFHNAVMHVEDDSLGDNVVAEELQKGYMYKDSVVRHSMVKVAN